MKSALMWDLYGDIARSMEPQQAVVSVLHPIVLPRLRSDPFCIA